MSRVRPDLPQAFDGVIATAMAKAPGDRFDSCGELAHAARNAASGAVRRVDAETPGRAPTIASQPAAPLEAPLEPETRPAASPPEPAAAEPAAARGPWLTPARQLLLTLLLVVVAAAASGLVVYFVTRGDHVTAPAAAPKVPAFHTLAQIVPEPVWQTCEKQAKPRPGALETALCTPPANPTSFTPDRLELSTFPSGAAVVRAYGAERRSHHVARNQGSCNGLSWGGEGTWLHNPASPGAPPKTGGSRFCYFAGHDAVIVWTHRKFGQPTHIDLLGISQEGGSDHPGLFNWWRFWHHRIGKTSF